MLHMHPKGSQLQPNAVGLVAYFIQIVHYMHNGSATAVSHTRQPQCSLVPKQGCIVWEHWVSFLVMKWLQKQSQGWFFNFPRKGGGGMPLDAPNWCVCADTLPLQLGYIVAPNSNFRPCISKPLANVLSSVWTLHASSVSLVKWTFMARSEASEGNCLSATFV